jgi:hypothetical protein
MGLLDLNKRGGLFAPPETYTTPGIGDGLPGARPMGGQIGGAEMFNDVNTPYGGDQPEKRGGFLGSGYGGDDIMSMLLRAAAIAQGDLGAGAQFGANIGKRARAEAEAAQQEAQWRARKQWEWDNSPKEAPTPYRWKNNEGDLMEAGADGTPRLVYDDPTRKPEIRVGPDGKFYAIDVATPPAAPIGKLTPMTGDDAGNGVGGFRR